MWAKGSQRESGVQSARFFIVDLEGRASVAQLCCLGPGVSNKKNCCCKPIIFVGGWLRAVRCHAEIQRSFFGNIARMNSLWRRQGKFLICTYTPRCSCVYLQFIHCVMPTMRGSRYVCRTNEQYGDHAWRDTLPTVRPGNLPAGGGDAVRLIGLSSPEGTPPGVLTFLCPNSSVYKPEHAVLLTLLKKHRKAAGLNQVQCSEALDVHSRS